MTDANDHRFQVDLRGLIDLLSRHLYSGPNVFMRELLQNAVDAIQARRRVDPAHEGAIRIELVTTAAAPPTLLFQDDGVGLTGDELHRFLATIGQSSKRGEVARPEDFLGQFGIGLLSCFMVSDEIVVITRSAKTGEATSFEWRGKSDGTYSIRQLDREAPHDAQVFLRVKDEMAELFEPKRLMQLATHFGGYLESSIEFSHNDLADQLNEPPPWNTDALDPQTREELLEYGSRTFDRDFLDVIPLHSRAGDIDGLAFVLAAPAHTGAQQAHRVYLKNMLLSEKAENLLPDWAFFVQCIVNARDLRPTASRESFYEDELLGKARDELGRCLRSYLVQTARNDPQRLERILSIHHLSLKALALEDDECLELFADWFRFETSQGWMTFGEFRRKHSTVRYVSSLDKFRQISQVAASESLPVVNAGYVYDVEILERLAETHHDLDVEPFQLEELSDRFEQLELDEREKVLPLERLADIVLQPYKCVSEVSRFRPETLPALFVANDSADFLRSVEQSQEEADELWSGILSGVAETAAEHAYARLHLNYSNPLVQRIVELEDQQAQRRCVEMLYIQSLLLGHFPLRHGEVKLLNSGLLGLIDWALNEAQGDGQ